MSGAEGACSILWVETFFEEGRSRSIDALVCEEGNIIFNPGGDGEPVE